MLKAALSIVNKILPSRDDKVAKFEKQINKVDLQIKELKNEDYENWDHQEIVRLGVKRDQLKRLIEVYRG